MAASNWHSGKSIKSLYKKYIMKPYIDNEMYYMEFPNVFSSNEIALQTLTNFYETAFH